MCEQIREMRVSGECRALLGKRTVRQNESLSPTSVYQWNRIGIHWDYVSQLCAASDGDTRFRAEIQNGVRNLPQQLA
jgi:hypothetical protein